MFRRARTPFAIAAAASLLIASPAPAVTCGDDTLNVLLVVAHPDDEAMFAASVYKMTRALDAAVDLALVTDGSGGFRFSQLAEPIYGLDLTDESVARAYLPGIRKRELMNAGAIIGLRNYFFLDELDHEYTENADIVLSYVWDAARVRTRLREIMSRVDYDFVFVHLPIPNFHAHHKAATILTLQAVRDLPEPRRPVVLGSFIGSRTDPTAFPSGFTEHPGYPITRVRTDVGPFIFDRTRPIDPDGRLDYRIVVNWLIAEHRSQGTMQLLMNQGEIERFWYFELNDRDGLVRTRTLFERLADASLPPEPRNAGPY